MSPKRQTTPPPPPNQTPPNNNGQRRGPAPPPPPRWRPWLLVIGFLISIALLTLPSMHSASPKSLNFTQFTQQVDTGKVKTATVTNSGHVSGTLTGGGKYTSQIPVAIRDDNLINQLQSHKVEITGTNSSGESVLSVIIGLLPLIIFIGLFLWVGRAARKQLGGGGGVMGIGRSKAKIYDEDRPTTHFDDVAGYEGAKREVTEVVDFLKYPERYEKAGAVGPKGILMVGPPGTGKTLMARAVAGEAGVPFLALTGSSFVEMFVGVGASRVRDLFNDARKRAPSIIFIDEIDAIGAKRGSANSLGTNDEREQTLNQMLAEMDGFDPATGVVVIAATNRPEILDPALLRPGRFDRNVEIGLPNAVERLAILKVHTRSKKLEPGTDLDAISRGTPGFSGADLANLVNEAAIQAVRHNRSVLNDEDFDVARDRILLGRRESSNALLPEEKHSVAIHETGHALVAALSANADPVAKITILPAGQALGVTEQLPEVERHLYSESYLKDSLAVRLGGRAAELVVIGEASTGAANDLAGATQLATKMVREFGLSKKVGPIGYSPEGPNYLSHDVGGRQYAEATQRTIDEEVVTLVREAETRAIELLTTHRAELDAVVDLLLERETIDGNDLQAVIEHRQVAPRRVTVHAMDTVQDPLP